MRARVFEDQARDAFDRRIRIEEVDGLTELLQRLYQRVVVTQHHLVIELLVDPLLDDPLDVAEVAHHVAVVQLVGADLDLGDRVVAVQMLADAVVIEQPVPVAELDTFGDGVHRVIW